MQATIIAPEKPRPNEESRQALAVIIVVITGLCLGWLLMTDIEGRSMSFRSAGEAVSLSYPVSWMAGKAEEGTLLSIANPVSLASFRPTLKVYTRPLAQGQRLMDAATVWTLGRMKELREFRDLGAEQTTIAGRAALRVNYGYVADPPAGLGPAGLPIVVRASDTIVLLGSQFVVFSTVSDAGQDSGDPTFARVLATVKLTDK